MTAVLLLLDHDVAGHLAVALSRHRAALAKRGFPEPPGIAALQAAVLEVVNSSQQEAASVTVPVGSDNELHDREFLSRDDVHRITGVSLSTVDRWLRSSKLPSVRQGGIRRITRQDLDQFLAA